MEAAGAAIVDEPSGPPVSISISPSTSGAWRLQTLRSCGAGSRSTRAGERSAVSPAGRGLWWSHKQLVPGASPEGLQPLDSGQPVQVTHLAPPINQVEVSLDPFSTHWGMVFERMPPVHSLIVGSR